MTEVKAMFTRSTAFGFFLLIFGIGGCGEGTGLLATETTEGHSIRSLLPPSRSAIILIYDPQDCLSCFDDFPIWNELRRKSAGRIIILLSRAPTRAEWIQIRTARIGFDGILDTYPQAMDSPMALLIKDGQIAMTVSAAEDPKGIIESFERLILLERR